MTRARHVCDDAPMEDRCTHGYSFEMTDGDVDRYIEHRVPTMLARRGVERATLWRNAHRDRTDLPRVLPEFEHLAIYEVDATFDGEVDDAESDDRGDGLVGAHHFVRTPRPGQGNLSGKPTIGLSVVLISPRDEDQAKALRDWGDFVHIRHIAEASVPGYTMITPYVNARPGGHPRFLHLYEIDSEDPERVFKSMTPIVTARLGGSDHEMWRHWAHTPSLRIMYVNTFTRLGVYER